MVIPRYQFYKDSAAIPKQTQAVCSRVQLVGGNSSPRVFLVDCGNLRLP